MAIYARVSTVKQADNDISINDQICRVRDFVTARGGIVVKECIEPGASAWAVRCVIATRSSCRAFRPTKR